VVWLCIIGWATTNNLPHTSPLLLTDTYKSRTLLHVNC